MRLFARKLGVFVELDLEGHIVMFSACLLGPSATTHRAKPWPWPRQPTSPTPNPFEHPPNNSKRLSDPSESTSALSRYFALKDNILPTSDLGYNPRSIKPPCKPQSCDCLFHPYVLQSIISSMHWLLNFLLGITLTLFSCNFFAMATDFRK